MAINISRDPDYSDLDLDFQINPITGDINRLVGGDAIKRSIRNLIFTNYYDRPFRSYIGSNIRNIMFENANPFTASQLRIAITDVINNFEPRVNIIDIEVNDQLEENAVNVTLIFSIVNTTRPITLDLALERTR